MSIFPVPRTTGEWIVHITTGRPVSIINRLSRFFSASACEDDAAFDDRPIAQRCCSATRTALMIVETASERAREPLRPSS